MAQYVCLSVYLFVLLSIYLTFTSKRLDGIAPNVPEISIRDLGVSFLREMWRVYDFKNSLLIEQHKTNEEHIKMNCAYFKMPTQEKNYFFL